MCAGSGPGSGRDDLQVLSEIGELAYYHSRASRVAEEVDMQAVGEIKSVLPA